VSRFLAPALIVVAGCAGDDGAHCGVPCSTPVASVPIGDVSLASLPGSTITIAMNQEQRTASLPVPDNSGSQSVVLGNVQVFTETSETDPAIVHITAWLDYGTATSTGTDTYGASIRQSDGSEIVARNWTATITMSPGCHGMICMHVTAAFR
jgi:hypothetical protein